MDTKAILIILAMATIFGLAESAATFGKNTYPDGGFVNREYYPAPVYQPAYQTVYRPAYQPVQYGAGSNLWSRVKRHWGGGWSGYGRRDGSYSYAFPGEKVRGLPQGR